MRDRQLRAEERARKKSRNQEEVQRRRKEKAVASAAKETAGAEKRAIGQAYGMLEYFLLYV